MTEQEKPIITSLLWTDLYKVTMGQAVFHNYPEVGAVYEYINRGKHEFPVGFGEKLQAQVEMMADLSLTKSDREFLERKSPYLQPDYLDYFENYRFNPNEVHIEQSGTELRIDIEGPWQRTIYWEVPLMALICEMFYQENGQTPDSQYVNRARKKGRQMKEADAWFFEFGTRRAFSHNVHRNVLEALVETSGTPENGGVLLGTSNIALAKEFDLNPGGTYAHEWVMGMAALFGFENANRKAMEIWADEYLGRTGGEAFPKLGTALMDTYTTEAFLKGLTAELMAYYTYGRQDSGVPIEKGEKAYKRLEELGFDTQKKGVAFTDGLSIEKALEVNAYFKDKLHVFGIGTELTNDAGHRPMNMVIKTHAYTKDGIWLPACKLSDDVGKGSGDIAALKEARQIFSVI